jgi:hypothetical protein
MHNDRIEEGAISDEALEAAGTRTESAAVWTILCTSSIQCNYVCLNEKTEIAGSSGHV